MSRHRVVVVWESSEAYEVEADDRDDANDQAIEQAMNDHPFAENYETLWEPELLPEPTS